MKTDHQKRIEELMRRASQELPIKPIMPPQAVRQLRANLILEEALETIEALGFAVKLNNNDFVAVQMGEPDIVKVVDGCADVSVVTIGTLSAFGVSDQPILEAVDANNLEKFGPGSYRREDGKWIKPPGHKPADIMDLLIKQGYGDKYFGQPEHAAPGFQPK